MKFYEAEVMNEAVTSIKSMTGEILYLIQGDEGAVLIDAGPGVGRLKALTEELTQKPLRVLLTHGHVDHAPGCVEFERVYLNKKDQDLYRRHCSFLERKGYLKSCMGERFRMLMETDFIKEDPDKRFEELTEGMVFDLGGLHVEVYELPGHTKGSVTFLIPEQQILVLGDSCNNATFLFDQDSSTVEEYLWELERIEKLLKGRYKRVFLSHHIMETDREIIPNMILLCEDILSGNTDDEPFSFMGNEAFIAKSCNERFERRDGKSGNLIYNKARIWCGSMENK